MTRRNPREQSARARKVSLLRREIDSYETYERLVRGSCKRPDCETCEYIVDLIARAKTDLLAATATKGPT